MTLNETAIRQAYREVAKDPRFTPVSWDDAIGTAYKPLGPDFTGLGYQYPHERTLRGKIKADKNEEGWFLAVSIKGTCSHVRLGLRGKSSYADVAEAIETLFTID